MRQERKGTGSCVFLLTRFGVITLHKLSKRQTSALPSTRNASHIKPYQILGIPGKQTVRAQTSLAKGKGDVCAQAYKNPQQ